MKYVLLDTIGSVINADGTWQTEVDAGIVREVLTEYREAGAHRSADGQSCGCLIEGE